MPVKINVTDNNDCSPGRNLLEGSPVTVRFECELLKMDKEEMRYHLERLNPGELYWDKINKEPVEFRYIGQTGFAIVCEPGDSGGGIQSYWKVNPNNLEKKVS